MNTPQSAVRSTLFSSVGIYAEYVLGMVVSILIARHLQPAGFGSYSVIIWMVSVGVVFTNSGTATAAIRFVAELRGGQQPELIAPLLHYLRRAQMMFLAVVLAVGLSALLFAGPHVAPDLHHGALAAFLALTVAVRALYMFNIGIAKGFQNFRGTALIALASAPLTLLMVAIATWMDAPLEAFLGVFVVSSLILYFMSRAQTVAWVPPSAVVSLPVELLDRVKRHMLLTAMTVTLGFVVASELEVLFLKLLASDEAAGQFKVAYQLAIGAALLVPGVFAAILLPMMANALKQGAEVAAQRFVASTRYLTLLASPLVAFGVVFSVPIINTLYGAAYAPAAAAFAACLFGGSVLTMTQGGSSFLISADRQGSILLMTAVMAVLKIGLDIVLITHWGLQGAIYAYLVVSLLCAATVMLLAIRASGTSPEWTLLLRVGMASAAGGAVAWPLLDRVPPLMAIGLGGVVVCAVYLPLTLLLNCWSRSDIDYMRALHQRLGTRRSRFIDRMLDHAHRRAQA